MVFNRVDLPAPFGPTRAIKYPCFALNLISCARILSLLPCLQPIDKSLASIIVLGISLEE